MTVGGSFLKHMEVSYTRKVLYKCRPLTIKLLLKIFILPEAVCAVCLTENTLSSPACACPGPRDLMGNN